jgi:hypothetical protein
MNSLRNLLNGNSTLSVAFYLFYLFIEFIFLPESPKDSRHQLWNNLNYNHNKNCIRSYNTRNLFKASVNTDWWVLTLVGFAWAIWHSEFYHHFMIRREKIEKNHLYHYYEREIMSLFLINMHYGALTFTLVDFNMRLKWCIVIL